MKTPPSVLPAKKRFGQHFLHQGPVISRIVAAICPQPTDQMLEIGPGLGALTQPLLAHLQELTVIELDKDLIPLLEAQCASLGRVTIYSADVLRFDFHLLGVPEKTWRIVGNLPYNISTPLLFRLLEYRQGIVDMHFMLQKEVVDRIVARPGDSDYGRLSVMIQYHCQVKKLFTVKPGAFQPPPKVDSAIVRLVPYQTLPVVAKDLKLFTEIVRTAFSQRRKMLRNTLSSYLSATQLLDLGIDPAERPEQLTVEDYVRISNYFTTIRSA